MKKLSIILGILFFYNAGVFADEVQPTQIAEDNRAVIAVQKQPALDQQKQVATRNWFCIIIQCNGKIKDSADNNAE